MAVLIDSSIYIDWMRRRYEFIPEIAKLQLRMPVYTCGIIQSEVARGILHESMRNRFLEFSDLLEMIPTNQEIWRETTLLAWQLDRKGITLPLTDLAIAACAKTVGATVVTLDADFRKIPGLAVAGSL